MIKLKRLFRDYKFTWKDLPKFIDWAVLLVFLLWNAGLFFGSSRVTDEWGKMIEPARPFVFAGLIVCIFSAFLHGLSKAYGWPEKRKIWLPHRFRKLFTCFLWFIVILGNAILSFHEIEFINNPWILKMADVYIVLGCGITFILYLIFVFLVNSVSVGMMIGNIFFLVWGIADYFVYSFRTIPLQWIDFGSIGTAAHVAKGYKYTLTWQIVSAIVLTCCLCGFYLHERGFRLFGKMRGKILSRAAAVLLAFAFYGVIFKTDFLAGTGIWLRDWHPQYTYEVFGMESGFLAFAKASYPEQPKTYSADKVEDIIETSEEGENGAQASLTVPDNIICIMNESFSDLSIYPNLKTDKEVMPYLDSITENAQQGPLMVSVLGGTTANTEYEFLTGNSMLLSPSTVVYNSFIKQDQFSLARTLSDQGYTPVALHPYYPNGWNREIVYPRMGFDEFLSLDAFTGAELVRGFVSDLSDYKKITGLAEHKDAGEKLFIFNVTMQNHSDYDVDDFESSINVEDYQGDFLSEAEQYESLIRLSDESLKYLIDYFSKSSEKTLICFFGDHQPALDDDFMDYAYGKTSDQLSFDEQQLRYETRYLIWANYDIPEAQGQTLSANYLSSYLLSLTGLENTGYGQYLMGLREKIPALNAYGFLGTDGHQHEYGSDEITDAENDEIEDYRCLIYDELTQGGKRDENFYGIPTDTD